MANIDAIEIGEQSTDDGAILFDKSCALQAGRFEPAWFEPAYWRRAGLAHDTAGGRGGVTFVHTPPDQRGGWVLRHYRRGGMVASLLGDRYRWNSAERTRSFAELRLLAELRRRGLDVPYPVAARYQRHGVVYRADLITLEISEASTLAQLFAKRRVEASILQRVGVALARLHAAGGFHADLNAHNILVDASKAWIIDFDRGELRVANLTWQSANLERLKRSLLKIGAAREGIARFDQEIWAPLSAAYQDRLNTLDTTTLAGAR